MQEIVIKYQPSPKQQLFHDCGCDEVFYGGAKGGGKSFALVWDAYRYGMQYPGAEIYLFRETYDDLEANIISTWKIEIPQETYKYNASKYVATLINGTSVKFRYVRNFQDANGYQGRSIDYIGIDELTKHEEATVQELQSCLRSPRHGYPTRFRATGNPGGIGHRWAKKRYITKTNYGKRKYRDNKSGNSIAFIPATVRDNPYMEANDPKYKRRLENLSYEQREAYLEGNWDVFIGQGFPEWEENIHVCEPFEIPSWWRRFMSADNGYADPFYFGWYAVSPDGQVYLYREFTRDRDDPRLYYTDQADKVMQLSQRAEIVDGEVQETQEKIDYIVAGVDAWNKHHRDQTGKSLIDYYYEGGITYGFTKAVTDRKLRKATMHEYLKPYKDEFDNITSKLQIFNTCKTAIANFPELVEDEDDPEMIADTEYDHFYDSIGYGIISYHMDKSKTPPADKSPLQKHKEQLAKRRQMASRIGKRLM